MRKYAGKYESVIFSGTCGGGSELLKARLMSIQVDLGQECSCLNEVSVGFVAAKPIWECLPRSYSVI